jgi:outer membrane protein, heavy metal efflux system
VANAWGRAPWGACGIVVLLAACTAPAPSPLQADAVSRALQQRRLDDPRLLRFIASATAGRTSEPAPFRWDLDRLVLAALYFHPDLGIARSRLQIARAHARVVRARPTPSMGASVGRGAAAALASPWLIGAAVDFLIEPGNRRGMRAAEADALVGAARADLRQAAWQVRARVYAALLDNWAAQRHLEPLRQQFELQSRRTELVGRRVAAGENPRADERRESAQRDLYAAALAQAQADLARSRADLAQAVGVPLPAFDGVELSVDGLDRVPEIDEAAGGALLQDALRGRADLLEAAAALDAAQAALQTEASRRWPDLRIGPGYQFDLGADKYTVSVAADWPRSDEAIDAALAEALARRDLAARQLLAIQARVLAQVDHARAAWRAAQPAARAAQDQQQLAERREQDAQSRFDAGALDRPALLAARIDRVDAQRIGQSALERQRRALADLEDALQCALESGHSGVFAPEADPGPALTAVDALAGPP